MKVIGVTQGRQDFFRLIDDVIAHSEPVQITAKRGDVVMISLADWNALQETIYITSVPGMLESLITARDEPLSEGTPMEDIQWDTK